jgi:stage V sporulation protein B
MTGKFGAAGGTLGTGAGVLAGILFMLFTYFLNRKTISKRINRDKTVKAESYRQVFHVIFMMVTPIIFATGIYNCTAIVDQNIFTALMDWRNIPPQEVTREYALFSYRVKPILNIPVSLASATSTALIPAVATAISAGRDREAADRINEAMRLSMFLAVPASVGLAVLSYPVIRIMYPTGDIWGAAILLSLGAVSVIFYSLSTVTNGVLQGLGHPGDPVKNAFIALIINIVSAVLLVGFMHADICGILAATVLYAASVMVLNAFSLKKYLDYKHDLKRLLIQPLMAAVLMGVIVGAIYWIPSIFLPGVFRGYLASAVLTLIAVLAGILVYVISYTKATHMTDEEIKKLPFGRKILVLLRKIKVR